MPFLDFTAPCPYCYTDIDLRRVDFRCLGRPAAGRQACSKDVDKAREKQFNDLNEHYPAFTLSKGQSLRQVRNAECPRCYGKTGVRLCPQCHSKLPDGFAGDSPLFGLVGARSAGKTVMLAVLMRELATNGPVARRFSHTITVYGAGEENGQARKLKGFLDQMESATGILPAQTQQAGSVKTTPVVFEWKIARDGFTKTALGDYKSTVFSFYDTAGEDLATEDRAESMTYLLATDGIILLLDPFAFPGNTPRDKASADQRVETSPENVLSAVTSVLRLNEQTKRNRKIKQPVAVVISKIDAFFGDISSNDPIRHASSKLPCYDEVEAGSVHDHIAAMVAHWGGDGLLRMLDTNYANYRLFGLSALGSEPHYSTQKIDERGILPHRVAEPLLWLMAERGFIPRQG
ncbi:MAG TPA: hypothetical protein VFC03_20895 [Acidimicrobiales bacterium]|nr:hypothetical protein [Acidimicrobiales bacterium]